MKCIPSWINIIPLYELTNNPNLYKKILLSRNIIFRILKNIVFNNYTIKLFVPSKIYDVSISYSGYHSFCNKLAGKINANKKLIWCHGDFFKQIALDKKFKNKFDKISKDYKLFDNIVCVSKMACQNMIKLCPEHKYKLTYLYNIIKKRDLAYCAEQIDIKKDSSYFYVLTISRLNNFKGIDRLLLTAERLKSYNIKFLIAGSGPLKSKYEKIILDKKLDNIILLGDVINIKQLFNISDLYLSCSDCESFGISIMESILYRKPVLATPTSGAKEIFKYIAPPGSVSLTSSFCENDLAQSIISIKENYKNAVINFSLDIENFNDKIITRFDNLLK